MRVSYLFLFVASAVLLYAAACHSLPFARCRRCRGAGVRIGKTTILRRPVGKTCRWCGGSGRRLRWGRRAWNHFAKIRAAASR